MSVNEMAVKIFMKDGQQKNGVLINDLSTDLENNPVFKFICNSNYKKFSETNNTNLIELLHKQKVNAIDAFLR